MKKQDELTFNKIGELINNFKIYLFPDYFCYDQESLETKILHDLKTQLDIAVFTSKKAIDIDTIIEKIKSSYLELKTLLKGDLDAFLKGDPAAYDDKEIILIYPGFFAILVYRIAHIFYELEIPYIPRMMCEYAHQKTGIDIHPGAKIGKNFFIDHGTGVVIGQTTIIGDNVKIYQGVTLGALSLKKGSKLKGQKRHPTIKNNVTIYSNSTVLGGNTIIGNNVTIAANTLILKSIPDNSIAKTHFEESDLDVIKKIN